MIIIIGLIIAFILIVVFSNPRTRNCRWREDRRADCGDARCYRCLSCGGKAFTITGKPPLDCRVNPKR